MATQNTATSAMSSLWSHYGSITTIIPCFNKLVVSSQSKAVVPEWTVRFGASSQLVSTSVTNIQYGCDLAIQETFTQLNARVPSTEVCE